MRESLLAKITLFFLALVAGLMGFGFLAWLFRVIFASL